MASTLLPVKLSGVTVPFSGNGRKLGFPTANIKSPTDLPDGVYFGFAELNNYRGRSALIFIGTPTTMGDTERRIEAHLFNIPDQDYYGQKLTITVHHYHRPNQTFDSILQLTQAMADDNIQALKWFNLHKMS